MKIKVLSLAVLTISLVVLNSVGAAEKSPIFLIPKKVHFVWMGNKLPQKYIHNIRSFVSRNADYEFYLWIDKRSNYERSNALLDSGTLPLRFRDLNEVVPRVPSELRSYFERERAGVFPNYAAASDIIRIQILKEEGGIYFDTDVFMEEKLEEPSKEDPVVTANHKKSRPDPVNTGDEILVSEIAEYFEEVAPLWEKFKAEVRRQAGLKHIEFGPLSLFRKRTSSSRDQELLQAIQEKKLELRKNKESILQFFRAPISRLGNIYAPFGFLYNVDIKGDVTNHNNNVLAAVKDSYFLKAIQRRMILKHQYEEATTAVGSSIGSDGKVRTWTPYIWTLKRHDPKGTNRFDMTIEFTGPGIVADAAQLDIYPYLASLPVETVDLIVAEFPELLSEWEKDLKDRYLAPQFIHGKYLFVDGDDLLVKGFKFNLLGFRDQCDNTWTQEKVNLNGKRPAEWH